jgi:hypothetical protein
MDKPLVFAISPIHKTSDFPNGWTLDDKINVIVARIEGWQIGIAKEIIRHGIPHSDFALLHIVFSYFEMIGKYLYGYIDKYESKNYFKKGVKVTFPEISNVDENFLDILYDSVRNGLYHVGMTKINVMLSCEVFPGSIGYIPERKILALCPSRLVEDLDIRFHEYVSQLRDQKNVELRKNFEKRFDYDNSEVSL